VQVRCPGPKLPDGSRAGCTAVLPIQANYCADCGTTFSGHELEEAHLQRTGYMEAELSELRDE
jgi:hypothetical protein